MSCAYPEYGAKKGLKLYKDTRMESFDNRRRFDIKDVIYYNSTVHGDAYEVFIRKEKKNATYDVIEIVANDILEKKLKKANIPIAKLYTLAELNEENYYMYIVKDYVTNIRKIVNKYILIDIIDDINIINTDVLINNHNNSFYKEMNTLYSTV